MDGLRALLTPREMIVPRKVCDWSEIEADSGIYNTCREGEEFHLTEGLELYPFCHWCGGKIRVTEPQPAEPK
jgi:hypothetical protein